MDNIIRIQAAMHNAGQFWQAIKDKNPDGLHLAVDMFISEIADIFDAPELDANNLMEV